MKMETDRLLALLAKKTAQSATAEELQELNRLLVKQPEYSFFAALVDAVEREPQQLQHPEVADRWSDLAAQLPLESSGPVAYPWAGKGRRHIWRTAAVWTGLLLLTAGASWVLWPSKPTGLQQAQQQDVLHAAHVAPRRYVLPDGSTVWLNADSYIRFNRGLAGVNREVFLRGEAYFDIHHDPARPFIVHAAGINIQVLGTAFNVQAYEDDDAVATTLINGKIRVQVDALPEKSFVLQPNEKLMIASHNYVLSRQPLQPIEGRVKKELQLKVQELTPPNKTAQLPEVAWLEDKLVFRDEPFGELARRLERRYGVKLIFEDPALKKEPLNGVFKNENIQNALAILQMTTPFTYSRKADTVFLHSKP